ncbi:hypothetical protein L3Q67_01775 [Saccharothrix sp. AJ9571]|nr:hypothetical protein L3Q67_01775 [Saccharothrix sp. AJ9571]
MHLDTSLARTRIRRSATAAARFPWAQLTGYGALIVIANGLTGYLGPIAVGFGLLSPAAVYAIGPAIILRASILRRAGRASALVTLMLANAVSLLVAEVRIVGALSLSFAMTEAVDYLSSRYLQPYREWIVVAKVGMLPAESAVFISIAFGSLSIMPGYILGKIYGVAFALSWAYGRRTLRRRGVAAARQEGSSNRGDASREQAP